MSSHRSAACLLAALVSTCALSTSGALAQTTVTSAPPASFTLSNGLQVVVIPDHRTPVVTEMIRRLVGGADLVPDHLGDHGGAVILDYHDLQAVIEGKARRRIRGRAGLRRSSRCEQEEREEGGFELNCRHPDLCEIARTSPSGSKAPSSRVRPTLSRHEVWRVIRNSDPVSPRGQCRRLHAIMLTAKNGTTSFSGHHSVRQRKPLPVIRQTRLSPD